MTSRHRKGVEVWLYAALISTVDEGEWLIPHSGRLTPVKEQQNPLYRRLDGPQGLSGRVWRSENYLPPLAFEPQPSWSRSLLLKPVRASTCTGQCVGRM
jgi:hypothetical protein